MAGEVLWSKLIDTNYQCQCNSIDAYYGKLTVIDTTNNNVILEKELVLKEPLGYDQWESFCIEAINNQ